MKSNSLSKKKTTNFSVREEEEKLEAFDKTVAMKGSNRNATISKLMLEYVINNAKPVDFQSISIVDNKDKLGYKKSFFSYDDAALYAETIDVGGSDDDLKRDIAVFQETGVKYSFTEIGIVIYTVWYFSESRDSWNNPSMDLFFNALAHNLNTGHFEDITSDDSLSFLIYPNISYL